MTRTTPPPAPRQVTDIEPVSAVADDRSGPLEHPNTSDAPELRIHKAYGRDSAAPVVLEELGGAGLEPGQYLLVSRATLDRLRGQGGLS